MVYKSHLQDENENENDDDGDDGDGDDDNFFVFAVREFLQSSVW